MAKRTRQFVIDSARAVSTTAQSGTIDVSDEDGYYIQAVFAGMAATAAGNMKLQTSLDGTNFSDYPSSQQNFTNTTTNLVWEVTTKRHKLVRLALTATGTGAGTVTSTLYGETLED